MVLSRAKVPSLGGGKQGVMETAIGEREGRTLMNDNRPKKENIVKQAQDQSTKRCFFLEQELRPGIAVPAP